jgi:potassium-transporting ATPase KdpC subunit
MKINILPAIRLTLVCLLFFSGIYTLLIWGIARLVPGKGEGVAVSVNNKTVGYKLIGQLFNEDKYFWSRPSAVNYDASASGASNKGPSDPDYLKTVGAWIDTFMLHNPGISKDHIPIDMITASGSGLDPDISPQDAYVQVSRIASVRHIEQGKLDSLVKAHIQQPLWEMLGPSVINVLELNIALDNLAKEH